MKFRKEKEEWCYVTDVILLVSKDETSKSKVQYVISLMAVVRLAGMQVMQV